MFKRILIPLDSSKLAECVLPHLVAIARICEPEVQLLRVSEPFGVTARLRMIDPVDWQIRKAEAESYLSGIAARLQNAGLRVSTHLYDGRPAEQIIEVAHSWECRPNLDEQSRAKRYQSLECQQRCTAGHPARAPFPDDHPSLSTRDRRSDRPGLPQDLPSVRRFPASGNATDFSRISGTCPQQ